MIRSVLFILLLLTVSAQAKDYAVIVNENERQEMLNFIDAALKAQGIQVLDQAAIIAAKVKNAGEIVPHVDRPPSQSQPH